MYTNADMTLYCGDPKTGYTRSVIHGVFWQEVKQSNIEKTGLTSADSIKVFIPSSSAPDGLELTTSKDMVIKGVIKTDINNKSAQTISASVTALKAEHDVYTITVADGKLYGSLRMQHYQIMGR